MERTDADGRWESDDEVTWLLVEPSAEFLADQEAQRVDEPAPEVTLTDVVAALREPLANLNDLSTSVAQRTALLGLRSALDEFIP